MSLKVGRFRNPMSLKVGDPMSLKVGRFRDLIPPKYIVKGVGVVPLFQLPFINFTENPLHGGGI